MKEKGHCGVAPLKIGGIIVNDNSAKAQNFKYFMITSLQYLLRDTWENKTRHQVDS